MKAQTLQSSLPNPFPPSWSDSWGEDEYGLYADLVVASITQRFRWIAAGDYLMGSPKDEPERFNWEDQHKVTLSNGYWLADTAVTQALWQLIMSENPANFKNDPLNPVEQVSWGDSQKLIKQLNEMFSGQLDGLVFRLPSEAEWEHACRAGTTTPFNFEGEADLQSLNYTGIWGEKGWDDKALQKTAQVKSYPANDWGLYEMHGNVLEWCFDEWQEVLGSDPAIDPVTAQFQSKTKSITHLFPSAVAQAETDKTDSPEQKSPYDSALLTNADVGDVGRVLRGGSWRSNGRLCRSAIRLRDRAGGRDNRVGFRFSLGL